MTGLMPVASATPELLDEEEEDDEVVVPLKELELE